MKLRNIPCSEPYCRDSFLMDAKDPIKREKLHGWTIKETKGGWTIAFYSTHSRVKNKGMNHATRKDQP